MKDSVTDRIVEARDTTFLH